jgi:Capsule assembly protein Wzi/PAP2 superfamily
MLFCLSSLVCASGQKPVDNANGAERKCTDLSREPLPCPPIEKTAAKQPDTPEATADPTKVDAPSQRRSYSLERSLPKNLLEGQREFWTFPARLRLDDAYWGVPFGMMTGGLIAADTSIEKELPSNPDTIKRFDNLSNYGAIAFGGLVGGTYLMGRWKHNNYLKDTAWLAGEAGANGFISTLALKNVLGRDRPTEGNGQGDFFSGGQSFPSQHATAAWSVATVFAERYPGILTKIAMYGGASTVSLSRVIGQKHFSSDVFVGSVLGWYFGHQAVRRYEKEQAANEKWGTFVRSPDPRSTDPSYMGSPYEPLDSWVYPVFERLSALGYVRTAFLGQKPWTRMECARLILEAVDGSDRYSGDVPEPAKSYLNSLREEFKYELERNTGLSNLRAGVDSVYGRFTGISGNPLTDGYHFGQTIYNDYGRPYQEGFNAAIGFSASAAAGPFAVYARGEYQHAPSAPALPLSARSEIGRVDNLPIPPDTPYDEINRFRAIEAYASVNLGNWQISFGKQSLWWGPGTGGSLMFTNNAEPFYMVKLDRVSPIKLPIIERFLGPIRTQFIFGRLAGHRFLDLRPENNTVIGSWQSFVDPQPYIHATKFSMKPTPNFEMSVLVGAEFAGEGIPLNFHYFRRTFNNYSTGPQNNGNRETGFQFSYRIPGLRNWLTLYTDAMAEDEPNPIVYPRRSAMNPGLYLSHVPFVPKLDIRVEGVYTDLPNLRDFGVYYRDYHFRQGWTNNSNIMGSWIGRQGSGVQGWSTYWLNATDRIRLEYRYGDVSDSFIAGGGNYRDVGVSGEYFVKKGNVSVVGKIQHESWLIPALATSRQGNWATTLQLTYWPKRRPLK